MSTETPIVGSDLADLVTEDKLTREEAELVLTKLGYAIKRKLFVSVVHYTDGDTSVVKIYPLEKAQAEHLNDASGEETYALASDWKSSYDTNPIPSE